MTDPGGASDPGGPPVEKTSSSPAPPVERIGKYEIRGVLGKGGMGAVYRAFDPLLEREVALKAMLPQIADVPEHKQRFEREARAVARLTHPNVVMVFDLGYHTDGAPYIVMELLEGRDLAHASLETLEEKIAVVLQVLEGLGQAHKVGIVHRDIKPANVFLTTDGPAKITDFGVARLGASGNTGTGGLVGTADYMSPEQVSGQSLDGRSDLFSVGCLLCQLLTGKKPFEAESPLVTMYRIANGEPVIELPDSPLNELLRPVLDKALARDPAERYANAAEFSEALTACLEESVARTAGRGSKRRSPRAGKTETVAPSPAPGADPRQLFQLLREIYVGGKTGNLRFTASGGSRSLHVEKGRITHATSDRDREQLGEVLVRYGVISQHDLERAIEVQKRLGPLQSGPGPLDRPGLEEALGLHVREILFAMIEESQGAASFEELPDEEAPTDIASNLSTGQVILEATRRVLDPELVRQVLGDLDRVLIPSSDPMLRSQSITLTPTDGFVLSRVDGTVSASEVISLSPVPAEDTERSLFGLLLTGSVDYMEKTPSKASRKRGSPATGAERRPEATPPSSPATGDAAGERREEAGARAPEPTPPPEEPRASPPAAGESASERKEEAPPDDAPAPAADPAPAPDSTPAAPDEPPALGSSPAAADTPAPPADAAPAPESTAILPEDPAAKASPSAGGDSSGEHPPPPPRAGKSAPVLDQDFLDAPEAPVDAPDPASQVREAEACLAEQHYEDAIRLVEPLVPRLTGALRTRAAILLAQACMKGKKPHAEAEKALLGLVDEDPGCTPAYFTLGALYRSLDDNERARAMYRKVLELSPKHRGAAAELATLGDG